MLWSRAETFLPSIISAIVRAVEKTPTGDSVKYNSSRLQIQGTQLIAVSETTPYIIPKAATFRLPTSQLIYRRLIYTLNPM